MHILSAPCPSWLLHVQSDGSQLETKLSGMLVSSMGKRDSLLEKATDLTDKSAMKTSKPVSVSSDHLMDVMTLHKSKGLILSSRIDNIFSVQQEMVIFTNCFVKTISHTVLPLPETIIIVKL